MCRVLIIVQATLSPRRQLGHLVSITTTTTTSRIPAACEISELQDSGLTSHR